MKLVEGGGLEISLYMRYMDDGRKLLQPVKKGWRWVDGGMVYCRRWEEEDALLTPMEVTIGLLRSTAGCVIEYLDFTFESGADYPDGWLPTLDTSLRVNGANIVEYKYFEKPTTTNTVVRFKSAMSGNPKVQCLSNDLVRRLLNTKEQLPGTYRAGVVDGYAVKLMTSGYSREQVQKIVVGGIKGYQSKKDRRKKSSIGGGRLHRTAVESNLGRIRKKLLSKSSWYRSRRKEDDEGEHAIQHPGKGGKKPKKSGSSGATLKTRAVLFMEQTPGGELARRMREQLVSLEPTLGYKIRVVERTGQSIQKIFARTSVWSGLKCGREHCITCNKEGEDVPDCTRRRVVYESICTRCNPSSLNKGELKAQVSTNPSLYVGETSRSVQERAGEHWGAATKEQDKSHIHKHQKLEHPGEKPTFIFKVVSNHKTAGETNQGSSSR